MKHGSLFSGIGGFEIAAESMGWENVFHCEINPFGQRVLKYHYPNSISYDDITKTDFTIHRGQIDIITGGFPCQPYSQAGKRLGKEDDRHLWPEMLRVIREVQPRWVVGENVFGLINWNDGLVFDEVQADLEAEGYEVQPYVLPAVAVNAPHRRDRVWFVAYCENLGCEKGQSEHRKGNENSKWSNGECSQGWNKVRTVVDGLSQSATAPNPNSGGLERSIKVGRNCEYAKREDSSSSEIRTTTNPHCNGLDERNCDDEIDAGQRGEHAQRNIEQSNVDGYVADTDSTNNKTQSQKRILGQENKGRQTRRFINGDTRTQWLEFPTQSPICGGNDGLPTELDGITFSKWRAESIKAYGNAIVPQVALQIFKAIEQYENL